MTKCLRVAMAAVLLAANLQASGFKVNEQDSKAGGMGLAFTGEADTPGALATNIAGIGQLDGISASMTTALLYVPGREFDSEIDAVLADQQADDQLAVVPSLFLAAAIPCTPLHAGLGVYSMYGLTQDWNLTGTGGPPAPPAGFSREADRVKLQTAFFNPVVAYDVMPDHVTLAAGVVAAYGKLGAEANPVFTNPLTGATEELAELEQDVDGWDWSWNVAVHARVNDSLAFGAYYRHKLTLQMDGDFEANHLSPVVFGAAGSFETDEEVRLPLPGVAGVGVSFSPMCRLTVNVDFEYNIWSAFDDVSADLDAPLVNIAGAPVLDDDDLSRHPEWDDSWAARIGVEYMLTREIAARGGYFYDETPVPDDTIEPAVPDSSRHGITLGGGYKTCHFSVDVAYMLVIPEDRSVGPTPGGPLQDGTYSSDPIHVFMLTAGVHF